MNNLNETTKKIIGAAFKVSNTLGGGFLEKVYENALFIELRKSGLNVIKQYALTVFYDDEIVGDYFVDLFVENEIILELKSVSNLNAMHTAQLMHYLTACNKKCGLLLNFGNPKVEIKRLLNGYEEE